MQSMENCEDTIDSLIGKKGRKIHLQKVSQKARVAILIPDILNFRKNYQR